MKDKLLDDARYERRSKPSNHTVGAGKRIVNLIIDRIILIPSSIFIDWLYVLKIDYRTGEIEGLGLFQLLCLFFFASYYILMEGVVGQTLGKLITDTKVVDEQGNKPTLESIVLRTLCRLIPFNAFSFFGPKTIGWHDSLSTTYVVPKNWQASPQRDDILDS